MTQVMSGRDGDMRGGRHRPGRGSGISFDRSAREGESGSVTPPLKQPGKETRSMTAEGKTAGGTLKAAAARKKRTYRSQLTVMYIIAVIACMILGYVVGRRLLPGNEEQVAKSTLAEVGNNQPDTGAVAAGQYSEDLLPPLTTRVDSSLGAGAGVDDTAGGTAGSAASTGVVGAADSSTLPAGNQVPTVSLPVLSTGAGTGGPASPNTSSHQPAQSQQSQLQSESKLKPQPLVSPGSSAPSAVSSGGSSTSMKSEQAASGSVRTGAVTSPTSTTPDGATTGDGLYRVIIGRRASLVEAKALEARAKQEGLEVWVSGTGPYQVQVGAFRSRANAVAYAEELRSRGFTEATVIEPNP